MMLMYLGLMCLYMVLWKIVFGYDVVLVMDFIGILWGFILYFILWTGGVYSFS